MSFPVFAVPASLTDPACAIAGAAFHPPQQLADAAFALAILAPCGWLPATVALRPFGVPPAHSWVSCEISDSSLRLRDARMRQLCTFAKSHHRIYPCYTHSPLWR